MNRPCSYYRPVHARVVLVEAHDRFHDPRVLCCRLWIEVDHYAPQIKYRNAHGRPLSTVAKHQCPADPFILEKGLAALRLHDNVCAEAPAIETFHSGLATNARNRRQTDH